MEIPKNPSSDSFLPYAESMVQWQKHNFQSKRIKCTVQ